MRLYESNLKIIKTWREPLLRFDGTLSRSVLCVSYDEMSLRLSFCRLGGVLKCYLRPVSANVPEDKDVRGEANGSRRRLTCGAGLPSSHLTSPPAQFAAIVASRVQQETTSSCAVGDVTAGGNTAAPLLCLLAHHSPLITT